MMVVWFLFSLVQPAYIVFYLVVFATDPQETYKDHIDLAVLIVMIGAVALFIRILLMIVAFWVVRSFGKGLRNVFLNKYHKEASERTPLNVDL